MRVFQINSVPYGSTCRVMMGIAQAASQSGIECHTASGYSTHPLPSLPENHFQIGGLWSKAVHMFLARLTGLNGFFSLIPTLRLIRHIQRGHYDLLHFHNLHGWYVNLPLLMRYVKSSKLPVVWTLHDCWAFTGQCAHYTAIGCDRWKMQCRSCPQTHLYPQSLPDLSGIMHRCKRRWFASLPDLTFVTPSHWLADQLGSSFLQNYSVQVIPNGIDLTLFKPAQTLKNDTTYQILGVADGWTSRKGLDVLIELSKRLDSCYHITLVGTDEHTEKLIPKTITCIRRTQDTAELARLYANADVFVNPTYEDTLPTVTLEALACGTPAVVFHAGGSQECISENCGIAVPAGDVAELEKAVRWICTASPFRAADCVKHAKKFDKETAYQAYIALYQQKGEHLS